MVTTLAEAVALATRALTVARVARPGDDAWTLARYAAGAAVSDGAPVPDRYFEYVTRRAAREPVERITGVARFRGLELAIGPEVFVPRPETVAMVDHALAWLEENGPAAPIVVDLCTGSGVIALSLATALPKATVHAVEVSAEAAAVARRNTAEAGVRIHCGRAADALPELDGRVTLVVANPPYIPLGGHIHDPEVRDWDPDPALWAGPDGLAVIREVASAAARLLTPGGLVLVEHGSTQAAAVTGIFDAAPYWDAIEVYPTVDDNFLTAVRSSS